MKIRIPYDATHIEAEIADSRISAVLEPAAAEAAGNGGDLVTAALKAPINSARLCDLAADRRNILVITSDHTRPVPSKVTLPLLLREIRAKNPEVNVKILIATGLHRAMTGGEMADKFGADLLAAEEFINHDGYNSKNMVFKGVLPSGGELWLNSLIDWADMVASEGFIEPHFFAGFSGGRKSILPGIASEKTVLANHCADFIADSCATTGNLDGNPIHADMLFAAKSAKLAFILNVALNTEKRITAAFAGDSEAAHQAGCEFVRRQCLADASAADIVITSNGGYPLDQNIYQAVKGMTAAESCVNPGGIIIMIAACRDGHGGERFYRYFKEAQSSAELLERLGKVPQSQTLPDQWEAQILARILSKNKVILVADKGVSDIAEDMFMAWAPDLPQALKLAEEMVGAGATVTVIPDGVGVIVRV
ncbi:MAG: nickel-dependent lactate racemase [Oscillospiraceae bacterium]|nr:nickel-dependent lactate racemase [Oscillospiraceae bacterium]